MPDFFFLCAAVDGRHAHRRFLQYRDTIFIGWSAGELGLASVGRYLAAGDDVGAVGDMLGTGAAIIIAQSRGSGNLRLARLSLGNMLVWQVLFSLLDDDCRQMFSDRYTPSVRRYRRTDARRRACVIRGF